MIDWLTRAPQNAESLHVLPVYVWDFFQVFRFPHLIENANCPRSIPSYPDHLKCDKGPDSFQI